MAAQPHSIVVGVDDTAAGDEACRYAAAEAAVRRCPLTLVRAWQPYPFYPPGLWAPVPPPVQVDDLRAAADAVLDRARAVAVAEGRDVDVELLRVEGGTASALMKTATAAVLIVLGGRDHRQHDPVWLGSTVGHLVTRAPAPVVVVPVDAPRAGDVVVGVDGSDLSGEAIAFAFDQASRWGTGLRAVLSAFPGLGGVVPTAEALATMHETLRSQLSEAIAGWSEKYPDVPVTSLVSLEHPLQALRTAASDARLLVVGSHGRGALLRFALGSVSAAMLRAAPCAVAVVRHSPAGT